MAKDFCLDLSVAPETKRIPALPCTFEFTTLPRINENLPEGHRYPAFVADGSWYNGDGEKRDVVFALSAALMRTVHSLKDPSVVVGRRLQFSGGKITPAS